MPDKWNPFIDPSKASNLDFELLKKEIGRQFPFYDIKYGTNTVAFFCRVDKETLEENFDSLRKSLSEKGYIPMLRYEKGEHIIYVIPKPKKKERSVWFNIALLIATIITTILTGSIMYMGFSDIWDITNKINIFDPENLFYGTILFALPLMSILIIHEMGHYYISKSAGSK